VPVGRRRRRDRTLRDRSRLDRRLKKSEGIGLDVPNPRPMTTGEGSPSPIIGRDVSGRLSSPILIGRLPEMALLEDALARAEDGSPTFAIVGGEAGIGKSRLVAELAARARERGDLVLEGGCISLGSDEGLPFAPIAAALRGLVRRLDRAALDGLLDPATRELGRLVPELAPAADGAPIPEAPAEWAQTRLFDGFLTLLERLGARQPVVLVVEDLHWADRSTRDLLGFVARSLRAERALVVATYRSDEMHRRHPLRPWLGEMGRLPRGEEIELTRFDREELADQLAAIRGGDVEPTVVEVIARRSEGNPFFAEELLAAGSVERSRVSSRLRDVLLGRMSSVSEPGRRLLDAASVAGGAVDDELLAAVLDLDRADLTATLGEVVSSGHLVPSDDGSGKGYTFRHALLGEAVYDELLAPESRRLHGAFAAALDARGGLDGAAEATRLAALAHHSAAANDLPLALRATIASARASTATSAFHEAAEAFARAVALWDVVRDEERPPAEDHVELLYEAAGAVMADQRYEQARDLAAQAVAGVDPVAEPDRACQLEERLAWAIYLTGDVVAGIDVLERAAARAWAEPSLGTAAAHASLAQFYVYVGRYRDVIPMAETALEISRAVGARAHEVMAMTALGSALAIVGDCTRGLAVLRDALVVGFEIDDPFAIGSVYLALASTLYDCDAIEESAEVGRAGSAWARGLRFPGFEAMAIEALIPLGRLGEVTELLDDLARAGLPAADSLWNDALAGVVPVRQGRLGEAQSLAGVRRNGDSMLSDTAFAGNLAGSLLELAIAEGRLDDARALVDEALGWITAPADVRFRSRILRHGVRVEADMATRARDAHDVAREAVAMEIGSSRISQLREIVGPVGTGSVDRRGRAVRRVASAVRARLVPPPPGGGDARREGAAR
jgi:tetratricopeptide (TPR) repeat protein